MSSPKAIIFDVYKTLIDIKNDEESTDTYDFMSRWLSYHGLYMEPQEVYLSYKTFAKEEISLNSELYPDIDISHVFRKVIDLANTTNRELPATISKDASLLFRMLTTTSLTIYPETTTLLKTLYEKTRLAIASNSQREFTIPELKKFNIDKFFECIIFSSDVRACKPNAKIYRKVLRAMNLEPHTVAFVGDNLFDDIWGAQQLGIRTVWINREARTFPDGFTKPQPDIEVKGSDIKDLAYILLSMLNSKE